MHPGKNTSHGYATTMYRPYFQTKPEIVTKVEQAVQHRKPKDLYASRIANNSADAPRDLKQVRRIKDKARKAGGPKACGINIADDVLAAITLQQSSPEYIKKVILVKHQLLYCTLTTRSLTYVDFVVIVIQMLSEL